MTELHHRAEWIVLTAFHGWIAFAFLNSQLIDQAMEISARHAQRPRAFRFAPPALAQRAQDQRSLESAHFIFVGMAELRSFGPGAELDSQAARLRRAAGKLLTSTVCSSDSTIARCTTFSSSRTLPGQA